MRGFWNHLGLFHTQYRNSKKSTKVTSSNRAYHLQYGWYYIKLSTCLWTNDYTPWWIWSMDYCLLSTSELYYSSQHDLPLCIIYGYIMTLDKMVTNLLILCWCTNQIILPCNWIKSIDYCVNLIHYVFYVIRANNSRNQQSIFCAQQLETWNILADNSHLAMVWNWISMLFGLISDSGQSSIGILARATQNEISKAMWYIQVRME